MMPYRVELNLKYNFKRCTCVKVVLCLLLAGVGQETVVGWCSSEASWRILIFLNALSKIDYMDYISTCTFTLRIKCLKVTMQQLIFRFIPSTGWRSPCWPFWDNGLGENAWRYLASTVGFLCFPMSILWKSSNKKGIQLVV